MLLESDILFTSCSYPVPFLSDHDDANDDNDDDDDDNNNNNNNHRFLKLNSPPSVSLMRATSIY